MGKRTTMQNVPNYGYPGYWGESAEHPLCEWQALVANDETRQGYWEWVAAQKEAKTDTGAAR